MRAPVSVVIPTLDSERALPVTLSSLGEGLAEGILRELILVDGGSRDGTARIAAAAGAVWIASHTGLGARLAAGADAADGDWLLFLMPGTVLSTGWSSAVLDHIRDRPDHAGYFLLRFGRPGPLAAAAAGFANLRARQFGLPRPDHGLLVRRALYVRRRATVGLGGDGNGGLARPFRRQLRPIASRVIASDPRGRTA